MNSKDLAKIELDPGCSVLTYDAVELYPNIPTAECIQRISNLLSEQKDISKESLAAINEALIIVLKNNRVTFGDLFAIQDKGIATGAGPATAIANLFLGIFEKDNLSPDLLAFLPFIKDTLMTVLWFGNIALTLW